MNAAQILSRCVILISFAVLGAYPAFSQQTKKPEIQKFDDNVQSKASVFSGNESRIGQLTFYLPDCKASLPDVRIAKQPSNGELRLDAVKTIAAFDKDSKWANCNGKSVDAVGVFYKSKGDFTGEDRIVLDVDYKVGLVKRQTYVVTVR